MTADGALLVSYVDGTTNYTTTIPAVSGSVPGGLTASVISGVATAGNLGSAGNAVRSDYGNTSGAELAAVFASGKSSALMSSSGRDASGLVAPAPFSLSDDFFQFSLTAPEDGVITLDTLGFDLAVASNAGSPQSTAWALQLYASVNGGAYTAVGATLNIASASYAAGTATALPSASFDLSSLNAVGTITSVSFRVWQGSNLDTDSTLALAYQNINVQGTFVPEPSAALLCTAGGLVVLGRRRRA